jgi:hypothetical protein
VLSSAAALLDALFEQPAETYSGCAHVRLLSFSHATMTSCRLLFLSIELPIVHCYNALL